jgi:hypothetical protein
MMPPPDLMFRCPREPTPALASEATAAAVPRPWDDGQAVAGPGGARQATPLRAWVDPTFLYYRGANLVLRAGVALFRAGLAPRALLLRTLLVSRHLSRRGAQHRRTNRR